jgi:hypothetical protein
MPELILGPIAGGLLKISANLLRRAAEAGTILLKTYKYLPETIIRPIP